VDGRQVASPNDFSGVVATIERSVALTPGHHTLEVRLQSAPKGHLWITISGVIRIEDSSSLPRTGHTATPLPDGRVLVAAGRGEGGPLASAEVFDPETLGMSPIAGTLVSPRFGHTATLLPTAETLILSGADGAGPLDTAELFERAGIDIDKYLVRIPPEWHQKWVHAAAARGGRWNAAWARFFAEHPNATASEIWDFLKHMLDDVGFCGK
jgi:hypothetical protein